MTVRYHADLSSASYVGSTLMMLRWKGSLWKTVLQELVIWLVLYTIFTLTYRLWLNESQQNAFEQVVLTCHKYSDYIPLTFMLGFYVTQVVDRWWSCIIKMGLIDNPAIVIANYVRGNDEKAKMYRRNMIRYVLLAQMMVYRAISTAVKAKFPTLQSLVDAGYLEPEELERYSENNFWISTQWALSLARSARDEGYIKSDHGLEEVFKACTDFRQNHIILYVYSWIPIPLGYTQVVFISVRMYFVIAAIGRQFTFTNKDLWPIDTYVPIITIVQFIFYVGWLKVAEALLNPFGNDDDDFDTGWLLKRNLNRAFEVTDDRYATPPPLGDDKFWREAKEEKKAEQNGYQTTYLHQALSALPLFRGQMPQFRDRFEQ